MAEKIVADPVEEATGRTEMDLTPWIKADGIDWGDGDIAAYMADQTYGSSAVDFRVPNRTIQIPLMLRAQGGTSFATARENIQSKVARWQQEDGVLKRVTNAGGTLFCDVVNASLKLPGGWSQAHKDYDVEASLTVEARPDFYGPEVTLSDHVETSAAELVFTEATVKGNWPARVRMVVDEDQGQSQMGLFWGFQSRNYSAASTAGLAYEAEALQPLDTAAKAALTGASGGTVVTHGTLNTSWTPVLNLNLGGTAYLTHTGTYRMFCRYRTTSGTAVAIRSVYDVGDLVFPVENDPWYHPASTAGTSLYIADLGELRLQQGPVGTHRWAGQIQGKGAAGGENVSLDRVWFQPVDESAGLLRAVVSADPGLAAYSARDSFDQTAGNLAAKVAPVGGTWATTGGATDFTVDATNHYITRSVTTDANTDSGRFATLGSTNYAAVVAQMDFVYDGTSVGWNAYLFARYVDTSNLFVARVNINTGPIIQLSVYKKVAGAFTLLTAASEPGVSYPGSAWYSLRLLVDAAGRWWAWMFPQGATGGGSTAHSGQDPVLATGGTLASGLVGIYDAGIGGASARHYDNFFAFVPTGDAVLNASQSAELRTEGMVREDTSGTAYGPVSWVEGDLPRLPVSGFEGRTVRGIVKASRGDFQTLPDTGIDDISARVTYRPCWITVPGS